MGSYASSFSTSLKMMFANAGVIYKALGIPVNSFTVMFAMGFRFFEAKKAGGLSLSR